MAEKTVTKRRVITALTKVLGGTKIAQIRTTHIVELLFPPKKKK